MRNIRSWLGGAKQTLKSRTTACSLRKPPSITGEGDLRQGVQAAIETQLESKETEITCTCNTVQIHYQWIVSKCININFQR